MRKPHETQQQEHQATKNRIPLRNMALVRQTAYAMPANMHRALVQLGAEDIGVSFPQHVNAPLSKRTLGAVLRLHGTPTALQRL